MSHDDIAPEPADGDRGLDRRIRRSYVWLFGGQIGASLLAVAFESARSHLLSPTDVGLVVGGLWLVGLLQRVGELGLGTAIVQRKDLTAGQLTAIRDAIVGIAVACTVVAAALSPAMGAWFGNDRVAVVLLALLPMVLFALLQVAERSLLMRDLAFDAIVRAELVGTVVRLVVLVALALAGFGVWSLVVAFDLGTFATWAVLRRSCGFAAERPADRSQVRSAIVFGVQVSTATLLNFVYTNADYVLVGRFWSERVVGLYFSAYRLASLPSERVATVIQRVSFPVFVKVRGDPAALRHHYTRTLHHVSVATVPASVGLAAIAPDAIMALYGPQWIEIVPVVQLLCLSAALQGLKAIGGRVLLALGYVREILAMSALYVVVLVPMLALAAPRGLVPLAATWAIVGGLSHLAVLVYGGSVAGVRWTGLLVPIGRPLVGSAIMAIGVLLAADALPAFSELGVVGAAWLRTALLAAIGVVLYGAWTAVMERDLRRAAVAAIRRRSSGAAG